jgi:hypothetical protein
MQTATDGPFSPSGSKGTPFNAVTDGLSNTLMAGEKHVLQGHLGVGWLDSSIYNGNYTTPTVRSAGPDYPLAKSPTDHEWSGQQAVFGSWHPGICQFVYCDGSVHSLPVEIDPNVLGLLANKCDGQVIPQF